MLQTRHSLQAFALAAFIGLASPIHAYATSPTPAAESAPGVYGSPQGERAAALLERAADHIRKHGIMGVDAFSRQAEFIDRDLYVYALDMSGRFLASGGASAALVGQNVMEETDLQGRPFFREMVDMARTRDQGSIEYRWFNPADSSGEPKLTRFQRVGNIIVAVGYYAPRATPAQARSLLKSALKAMIDDEAAALAAFQQFKGPFVRDDLYVFVVDIATGKVLAHGANPGLVGSDGNAQQSPDGRPIVSEMLARVRKSGKGELEYDWTNPTTGRVERKHSFFASIHGRLVGVGYFSR
ncbi:cache domain-containing protein [Azoarcus sp. L1K30]|uniref:cache domain-containing protein n=1 Tax=Azoarcus sp. L1K30 TaxID=2820277 RepID=UPI001B8460D0|nr:cache domain-containing protein [Azoarcus sp. L1K30]MBR0565445.1 cache domain-containing protein [Azoarcus sp. L1K30]